MTLHLQSLTDLARNVARALTKPWTPRRDVVVCPVCKGVHR